MSVPPYFMRKVVALIAIAALLAFSWNVWFWRALKPVESSDTTRVIVTVPRGASTKSIASMLEEKGVIRSAYAFTRYAKKSGNAEKLQAGSFVLTKSMDAQGILTALTGASTQEAVVTIPEGFTVSDIDALLAEKGLSQPGAVARCARTCDFADFTFLPDGAGLAERGGRIEGYLYPDTYFVVTSDFDPQAFLERLLSTFRERILVGLSEDFLASKRSLQEIVTMASLIEEETRKSDERPAVSGILWKRFDGEMGLGVDATVRYVLEKQRGALTQEDLEVDSAYNLRKYRGLPPGPIASPGLSSIKAALHPEENPYYYYLHGSDGVIRYAVTNDEHNENKARYLR